MDLTRAAIADPQVNRHLGFFDFSAPTSFEHGCQPQGHKMLQDASKFQEERRQKRKNPNVPILVVPVREMS